MGSETVAFVVGPELSAAADIVARKYSGMLRVCGRGWLGSRGWYRALSHFRGPRKLREYSTLGLSQGGSLARDIDDTGNTPLNGQVV